MKHWIISVLLLGMLLSACNAVRATPTVSQNDIQTQVAQILTQMPATQNAPTEVQVTTIPTLAPTSTTAPTATQAPTNTESPTQIATETPTLTPTVTTAPSTTPPASDPRAQLGTPTFQDTFKDDKNWQIGDDKFTSFSIANNALTVKGLSTLDGWRLTWPTTSDFYLEATFTTGECSGNDRYGLIARVPDATTADRGYLVGATCDGKYALRKWDGEKMNNLVSWTASSVLHAGAKQTNRIGLLAVGDQLSVYLNGALAKTVQDNSFSKGSFGLFIGANQTANFTVTVTDVSYWENPKLK
ncbi:MAG: hypothetical protein PHQ40_08190 [Anaerolineaceae bacterium]|nr:hypothetical protein [Anaerolineaceae bacterium]